MALGLNKVQIIGHLGADPETRTFPNGGSITTVRIATTEKWKDRQTGEPKEVTEWHTIEFSNRLAEIVAQYLRKGSLIYVEGKLHTRSWDDKQTGQKRYMTTIRAAEMQMLGGRSDGQRSSGGGYNQQGAQRGYGSQQSQSWSGQSQQPNEYARQSAGSAQGYGNYNGGGYQKPQAAPAQPQPAPQAAPAPAPAAAAAPVPAGAFDDFGDDDIPF